eukprot:6183724-Pleurochrysis_carterae.AAC.2
MICLKQWRTHNDQIWCTQSHVKMLSIFGHCEGIDLEKRASAEAQDSSSFTTRAALPGHLTDSD